MSDMREKYSKLTALVDKTQKGEPVDTAEVLFLNNKVFTMIQDALTKGTAEEKKEAKALFKEYLLVLVGLSQKGAGSHSKEQQDLMGKAQEVLKRAGLDTSQL